MPSSIGRGKRDQSIFRIFSSLGTTSATSMFLQQMSVQATFTRVRDTTWWKSANDDYQGLLIAPAFLLFFFFAASHKIQFPHGSQAQHFAFLSC